jgi:manganese-dependent inorganic pyrophosphatase
MAKPAPHYIVGHKNPDSDTIVSAYVLAWLHQQINPEANACAIRLGDANPQTLWLFEQADCELPPLKKSCLYIASEIARAVPLVDEDCPLREALETMQRAETNFVAIVDKDNRPKGLVSDRTPRTNYLLQCNIEDMIGTLLNFGHLIRGLPLEPLTERPIKEIHRLDVPIHKSNVAGDWDAQTVIIIGDRELFLDSIDDNPPGAIIITGVDRTRALEIAAQVSCPVYRFGGSVISMLTRLPGCFPASAAMLEDFTSIDESAQENEINRSLQESHLGLIVLDAEGRVSGTISAVDVLKLKCPRVSLVDHSERGQSIHGLDKAEIVEIIDHHRLGDIETIQPLHIDVRPLGSTASILYDRIQEASVELPPHIAKLLLGALISDTLLLNSPTCTASDKVRARKLAKIADVDLQAYGLEVLRRNDRLATAPPEQLVSSDCKQFSFEDITFLAAQLETVDLAVLTEEREAALHEAFTHTVTHAGVAFGALMLTDVLIGQSRIIIVSTDTHWKEVHLPATVQQSKLPWIEESFVSRKKQLIPLLMKNIQHSKRK